jgi:oxalate decarboxylase/phosphoglucose isomerase-like protein (cupin superfamily)
VVHADAGDLVFKPRDQWHTFWNAGDGSCRILEIISPAGFEHYFNELAQASAHPRRTRNATAPSGCRRR